MLPKKTTMLKSSSSKKPSRSTTWRQKTQRSRLWPASRKLFWENSGLKATEARLRLKSLWQRCFTQTLKSAPIWSNLSPRSAKTTICSSSTTFCRFQPWLCSWLRSSTLTAAWVRSKIAASIWSKVSLRTTVSASSSTSSATKSCSVSSPMPSLTSSQCLTNCGTAPPTSTPAMKSTLAKCTQFYQTSSTRTSYLMRGGLMSSKRERSMTLSLILSRRRKIFSSLYSSS